MLSETLIILYSRELNSLAKEISAYENEGDIWKTVDGIANSAGNLCLHLVGNLDHFVGATLGDTGYARDREAEFSTKYLPREELLNRIEATTETIKKVLSGISDEDHLKEFPLETPMGVVKTGQMLIHLQGHLNYHLGQINYHRRLLDVT
jgi:uncharacterized damage-inducible protein DinB